MTAQTFGSLLYLMPHEVLFFSADRLQRRSEHRHQEKGHGSHHGLLQGGHHRSQLVDPLHQQSDAAQGLRDAGPPDPERGQSRTSLLKSHARVEGPGVALEEQVRVAIFQNKRSR